MAMQHTYNSALNASFIYKDSFVVCMPEGSKQDRLIGWPRKTGGLGNMGTDA